MKTLLEILSELDKSLIERFGSSLTEITVSEVVFSALPMETVIDDHEVINANELILNLQSGSIVIKKDKTAEIERLNYRIKMLQTELEKLK